MHNPLVTIICISYNHAAYIKDALHSVWDLDYPHIELIFVDDASTDNSQQIITELTADSAITCLLNTSNMGHCKAFNKALKLAKGEFVIDLAADDILLPNSVFQGVSCLQTMGKLYGVFFADLVHINAKGDEIGKHITTSFFKTGIVPQGDIYTQVLSTFFISPPTMIFRKTLLDKLGGYNEALSYEDFDFWVRSSRVTNYCYLPQVTVKKRIHSESVSAKQYSKNSNMLSSTLAVCKTAYRLNKNKSEDFALLKRLAYEAKMSLISTNFSIAFYMFILSLKVFFKVR